MVQKLQQSTIGALGLGSFGTLVLFALLSGALYENAATAFRFQTPLILAGDLGFAAGLALGLALETLLEKRPDLQRHSGSTVLLGCGLCAAVMLRSGMLFDAAPWDTVLGDGLLGFFLALTGWRWWLALLPLTSHDALLLLARALAGACLAFLALSLLPQGFILLAASLLIPLVTGGCLATFDCAPSVPSSDVGASDDQSDDPDGKTQKTARLPRVLVLAIVGSLFVADLLMSLFPVSLYTEASPLFAPLTGSVDAATLGNLTQPALIAALALLAFSLLLWVMARRHQLRLPLLCSLGFFAVAVGFVTFPYHMPGGAPIGIAEAGEGIIALFSLAAVRSYVRQHPGNRWNRAILLLALAAALAMVIADLIIIALYQLPFFDYIDFHIRSVLSGIGVLALVALLVGVMPHVYALTGTKKDSDESRTAGTDSPLSPEESAERALDAFAERYRLSPREREIVGLLSRGRDVPYIEQELVLSKSTVKTHIRHIYEKCGVSSRQDLLDLLHSSN
ncbi:helix-turn-helix transcriptional regulator [Adlercreutzia equolifaciens]|uniref:helix-turn-helix transcriptional regulator n=1 Tax=Adlercreutzia equolifaciens TaxID=446660 RepID=UPI0023AEB985|nr:helix-turn-helix transcriptional regulator [Adlercreutzia equolifaciens]MDE8703272.1 helix-turn-helix transcriptional regulator [Adlercreutzia equolifaciens]